VTTNKEPGMATETSDNHSKTSDNGSRAASHNGKGDEENPLHRLTAEQIEAIGKEFDELHDEVFDDLGDRDARYIRSIIALQRRLALLGRVILFGSRYRPAWVAGTAVLGMAKILENMEIGHNVMHGQWDWMNDPVINSSAWDWDTASTAEAWKHSHNYVHHTFTNIRGKDRDLGYEIMRIDTHQKWNPVYLAQPVYNLILAGLFEWGVALHDLDFDAIHSGDKNAKQIRRELKGIAGKARTQITKDYIAWPALSGLINTGVDLALAAAGVDLNEALPWRSAKPEPRRRLRQLRIKAKRKTKGNQTTVLQQLVERRSFREPYKATLKADVVANLMRNVWSYAIIFCGHFPDQTYTFSQEETEDESRGERYVRQLIGAANIEGSALFHVISGNLGYQVEHHLYPDMPSTRYGEIAPRVRQICEKYELPYNTGPFFQQLGMVQRTILRLAFPGGKPRPKPGPYHGDKIKGSGEQKTHVKESA
jgi:NADPH-dependent stearoyl-CoA 9-desaturase